MKSGFAGLSAALMLAACGGAETPAAPAKPAALAVAAAPEPPKPVEPETPPLGVTCGSELFNVRFSDTRAVVDAPGGSTMELRLLAGQPGAPTAVKVYTNGAMTFTREEVPGGASVVRFARGKMAFLECDVARG